MKAFIITISVIAIFSCGRKTTMPLGCSYLVNEFFKQKDTTFSYRLFGLYNNYSDFKPILISYPDSFNNKYNFGYISFYSVINRNSVLEDIEIESINMKKDTVYTFNYEKRHNEKAKNSDEFVLIKHHTLKIAKTISFIQTKPTTKKKKYLTYCSIRVDIVK